MGPREESRLCTKGALWLRLKVQPQGELGINPLSPILLSLGFQACARDGQVSWPFFYLHLLRGTSKAWTDPLGPGPQTLFFLGLEQSLASRAAAAGWADALNGGIALLLCL